MDLNFPQLDAMRGPFNISYSVSSGKSIVKIVILMLITHGRWDAMFFVLFIIHYFILFL